MNCRPCDTDCGAYCKCQCHVEWAEDSYLEMYRGLLAWNNFR